MTVRRRWRRVGVGVAVVLGVAFAVWAAMRSREVALPSFPGVGRMVVVTPEMRVGAAVVRMHPSGTIPAQRREQVAIRGGWKETVAKLDADLTAQGFRRLVANRYLAQWSRGDESAVAMSVYVKGQGLRIERLSLTRSANAVERAGRWLRERLRRP